MGRVGCPQVVTSIETVRQWFTGPRGAAGERGGTVREEHAELNGCGRESQTYVCGNIYPSNPKQLRRFQ